MKFEKSKFELGYAGWTHYEGRFVARCRQARDRNYFVKFLMANFTVEEYFDLTENKGLAPAEALKTKGYVSKTVQKILKQAGYPTDLAGYDAYIQAQMDERF